MVSVPVTTIRETRSVSNLVIHMKKGFIVSSDINICIPSIETSKGDELPILLLDTRGAKFRCCWIYIGRENSFRRCPYSFSWCGRCLSEAANGKPSIRIATHLA